MITSNQVVILANGEFPRSKSVRNILEQSRFLICLDGAIDQLRKNKISKKPDLIIGDLDSVSKKILKIFKNQVLKIEDQNTNDLEKAFQYLKKNKIKSVTLLGWSGLREDHMLGNFSVIMKNARFFNIHGISDFGSLYSYSSKVNDQWIKLKTFPRQGVSLFSSSSRTLISTKGLVWELNNIKLKNLGSGTLNQSRGSTIQIRLKHGEALIYFSK